MAEVLITLGIIGVVAAMTMPALVANSRKTEYSARLKKFNSVMEQAIRMSEFENGEMTDWVRGGNTQKDENGDTDFEANGKITKEFFMTYLAPYFKYASIKDGKNTVDEDGEKSGENTKIYLTDGTTLSLWNGDCLDVNFDVNGEAKPNIKGRDIFVFLVCFDASNRKNMCGNANTAYCSYGKSDNNRVSILNKCKNNANYCSRLLQFDNWEFNKDYPYRL